MALPSLSDGVIIALIGSLAPLLHIWYKDKLERKKPPPSRKKAKGLPGRRPNRRKSK